MKSTIILLFYLPLFSSAGVEVETFLKYPNKPKPFYPIEGEYQAVSGIAVSPVTNDIYFCDEIGGQIFKISGEQQFLVAGAGGEPDHRDGHILTSKFDSPQGISFHPNGTLLAVADTYNCVIRIVDLVKGTVSTIAGSPRKIGNTNGIGIAAKFKYPYDVAFDSRTGHFLFVADTYNHVVRKVSLASGNVTTFAGTGINTWDFAEGVATSVSMAQPISLFFDNSSSTLWISDFGNSAVRMVNSTGYLKTIFRNRAVIDAPKGIVKKGEVLFVADYYNHYMVAIDLASKSWSVFAGAKGLPGFYEGQKLDAQFSYPQSMTLSNSNDILFCDYFNNAVRVISDRSGLLYTLVKQRGWGYEDGPPATARFSFPQSMELDSFRNVLYVSDSVCNAIRRIHIDQGYRVDTLAGKPYSGFLDGSLDTSLFNSPYGIFLESNGRILYVCDYGNKAVRRIDLSFAGKVSTLVILKEHPISIAADNLGRLFVSTGSAEIYSFTETNPEPIKIAGTGQRLCEDGPALYASLSKIYAMVHDPLSKSIIFSDFNCFTIRKLSLENMTISIFAGQFGEEIAGLVDGYGSDARFRFPKGISLKDNELLVADTENSAIRRLNMSNSMVETMVGTGDCGHRNGNISIARLCHPNAAISNDTGTAIFTLETSNMIVRVIKDGFLMTIAGYGSSIYNSSFTAPTFIASARAMIVLDGRGLLFADTINNCILKADVGGSLQVIAGDGSKGWLDGIGTGAMLNGPMDLLPSQDESEVFIADSKNHLIRRLKLSSSEVTTFAGTGLAGNEIKSLLRESSFNEPQAMTMDPRTGIIYVADSGNNCIKRINGSAITIWAGSQTAGFKNGFSTSASFARPLGIAFDPDCNCLYLADTYNHAIRKIDARRVVTTVAGVNGASGFKDGDNMTASFSHPTKLIVAKGLLIVLDSGNHAVRLIDARFQVTTLFSDPDANLQAIAGDRLGNVYVSDSKSIRILILDRGQTRQNPLGDGKESVIPFIFVYIAVVSVCIGCAYKLYIWNRDKAKTIKILTKIGNKEPVTSTSDSSKTMSPSKTVVIAIPGYLRVSLKNAVQLPANMEASGKGGTAQIFRAKLKDPALIGKHGILDIVVKIFGKETSKESFLYEVMIMSALPKSPNLIELIGYNDDRRVSAIIMKDYPLSLRDLLVDKTFPNTPETNLKISHDIANGMNLIHQKGIIHFDLKPANVLAEFVNGDWNYVICDFGFANFLSDVQDKIVRGVRRPTALGITARYAAPELFVKVNMSQVSPSYGLRAPGEIEKAIDVYAYAMTLFYVYVREAPLKDLSIFQIEETVSDGKRPEFPGGIVPKMIESLITACWSQNPIERPSFHQILEILAL